MAWKLFFQILKLSYLIFIHSLVHFENVNLELFAKHLKRALTHP